MNNIKVIIKKHWKRGLAWLILIAALVVYFAKYNQINYYFYEKRANNYSGFSEVENDLRREYMAAAQNPGDASAILALAYRQYNLKDYKSATANFKKVLDIDSGNQLAYQNIVRSYQYLMDFPKAEEYAKKYIEEYPESVDAYGVLGNLYTSFYTEKSDDLDNLYKTAYEKTHQASFLLLRANFFAQKGNYDEAIKLAQQWLSDPNNTKDTPSRIAVEGQLKIYQEQKQKQK